MQKRGYQAGVEASASSAVAPRTQLWTSPVSGSRLPRTEWGRWQQLRAWGAGLSLSCPFRAPAMRGGSLAPRIRSLRGPCGALLRGSPGSPHGAPPCIWYEVRRVGAGGPTAALRWFPMGCPAHVHNAAGCTHVSLHVHVSTRAVHLHAACAHACQAAPLCMCMHAVGTPTSSPLPACPQPYTCT